jgi:hypothetical protein
MFGQPDYIFPVRSLRALPGGPEELQRTGFVSLWVGHFASVEEAEAYFGIPDAAGFYLPAEAFTRDFGLGTFPSEKLEVNFEQSMPRPFRELLQDVPYAGSFLDQAVAGAAQQGIEQAQGIALLYDFDYRGKAARCDESGPLRFISAYPYVRRWPQEELQPVYEVAQELGCPPGTVMFVLDALSEAVTKRPPVTLMFILHAVTGLVTKRRRERGNPTGFLTAREYCEFLLTCRGDDTPALLRDLGLLRSEDVGRVMFALIDKGLARSNEGDEQSDFDGLFVLE